MNRKVNQITNNVRQRYYLLKYWWSKYWFRTTIIAVAVYTFVQKEVQINFDFSPGEVQTVSMQQLQSGTVNAQSVAQFKMNPDHAAQNFRKRKQVNQEKLERQQRYVRIFAPAAVEEMRLHGIPASITLAQGLLETNAGASKLATKNNNHFGIKCFSHTCKKGHCSNFSDDTHKDFFRIYTNGRESYSAHSRLLNSKRYRHLKQYSTADYKSWAYGLKKAGYATDKRYAEKLIQLVEDLALYQYDEVM